jgi:hypothetical protein
VKTTCCLLNFPVLSISHQCWSNPEDVDALNPNFCSSNQFLGKRGVTSADPQLGRKFPFCRQTSNEFLPDLIKTRFSYDVVAFKTREKTAK